MNFDSHDQSSKNPRKSRGAGRARDRGQENLAGRGGRGQWIEKVPRGGAGKWPGPLEPAVRGARGLRDFEPTGGGYVHNHDFVTAGHNCDRRSQKMTKIWRFF